MLGIALIVLLGFFLYHYRAKDFGIEFKQPLYWSEFGKGCFVCQSIFLLALQCAYFILSVLTGNAFRVENRNMLLLPFDYLDPYSIVPNAFLYAFPVISALLTHKKLIEPLSEEKVPKQNLFHLIALFSVVPIVGFFSVQFIQMLSIFGYSVSLIMLRGHLLSLPIFSILLIGVFAVEIAKHKLKTQLTF